MKQNDLESLLSELRKVENKPDYPSIPLIEYGEDNLQKTLSNEVLYDQIKFSERT